MLNIGIITTTVRKDRVGPDVAKWALNYAKERNDKGVNYELIDIANYDLPVLGSYSTTEIQVKNIGQWSKKINELDGFIFITAEYNHSATGAIKNALDYLNKELNNKAASFVGYGGLGGARAIESLRLVLSELQVAHTQKTVNFTLANDFENFTKFAPKDYHGKNAELVFEQLLSWAKTLKTLRNN